MAVRRTILTVEELGPRILPAAPGVLGQLANPASAQSLLTSSAGSASPTAHQSVTRPDAALPILAEGQVILNGLFLRLVNHPAERLVINSGQDLSAATRLRTTQLAALLKVPSIDWHKQTIVLVSEGTGFFSAASPTVDITSLDTHGGSLTVEWHLVQPNPHQIFPMFIALGDPAEVVLTTKFTGPVTFHQDPTVTLPPPYAL